MVLPVFFILNASRIIRVAIGAGTAIARFVAKNPKIIGSTLSLQAISDAIQSHEATEKEKIQILNEIGKENPKLKFDILKNMFFSGTNIMSNILPYLLVFIIIYYFLKR